MEIDNLIKLAKIAGEMSALDNDNDNDVDIFWVKDWKESLEAIIESEQPKK